MATCSRVGVGVAVAVGVGVAVAVGVGVAVAVGVGVAVAVGVGVAVAVGVGVAVAVGVSVAVTMGVAVKGVAARVSVCVAVGVGGRVAVGRTGAGVAVGDVSVVVRSGLGSCETAAKWAGSVGVASSDGPAQQISRMATIPAGRQMSLGKLMSHRQVEP